MILDSDKFSIVHNCLLDFLELASSDRGTYIHYLLESLSNKEGVALEYSGVYLDVDPENTPDDLQGRPGITFSFMEDAVTLNTNEGIELIVDWCKKNTREHAGVDWDKLLSTCNKLEIVYGI